jgi:hypothetical protein
MVRRLILVVTLGALAGVVVFPLHPVHGTILNLAFLGSVLASWVGATVLVWKRWRWRCAALLCALLVGIPFVLPDGEIDPEALRRDYVRRLNAFEGTDYWWGGESSRGIDCSGLPRRAFRDALLAYGVSRLNGRAFRAFLEQWWFDASASALGEGYRSYTIPVVTSGTIQTMSYDRLMPGDLAVTRDGVHILAYVGDGKWIQADPGIGAVATLDGRTDNNLWFRTPVKTHRWKLLASSRQEESGPP